MVASFKGLKLVGGHPALDFVNTVEHRGRIKPNDALGSFGDLTEWCGLVGLLGEDEARGLHTLSSAQPALCRAALADAIAFREAFRRFLKGPGDDQVSFARAVGALEDAIAGLRPRVRLLHGNGELRLDFPLLAPADLVSRLMDSVRDLLARRSHLRIHECEGSNCDWLFVDASKAGRRRWCDAGSCGNLTRVRRHRSKGPRRSLAV